MSGVYNQCDILLSTRIYIAYQTAKKPPNTLDIKQAATHVARNLQNPEGAKTQVLFKNDRRDISQNMISKEEERQEMLKGRRATIADLNKYHKEVRKIYNK